MMYSMEMSFQSKQTTIIGTYFVKYFLMMIPMKNSQDLENDEGTITFEDTWIQGNLDAHPPQFQREKKINVDLPDECDMIDFFKLFISDEFIDEVLVQETNNKG